MIVKNVRINGETLMHSLVPALVRGKCKEKICSIFEHSFSELVQILWHLQFILANTYLLLYNFFTIPI